MEDEGGVWSLIKLIFLKKTTQLSEVKAQYPYIPPCLLTSEFLQSMQDVMTMRRTMLDYRWRKYFDTCSSKMLDSHEMYIRCIMYACLKEHECNLAIFDSFISICALVSNLSDEILQKTGVDCRVLNPFIVMEFYRINIKNFFRRRGGILRLVEYIRSHRYLRWKFQEKAIVLPVDPIAFANQMHTVFTEKLYKELKRERVIEMVINLDEVVNDGKSFFLAQAFLKTAEGVPLPPLPSQRDLVRVLVEYREKERAKAAAKFEALKGVFQGSNLDSEISSTPRHKDHRVRCENIIQEVIKYNHSKSSVKENASDRLKEEAGGILERLKRAIESLDEVLDGYDKE